MHYTDQTFAREDVLLDGHRFGAGVVIRGDCRLIYRGGLLPELAADCRIEPGARLVLDGPAARTVQLLALLCQTAGDGGQETVARLFREVCYGTTWLDDQHRDRGKPP